MLDIRNFVPSAPGTRSTRFFQAAWVVNDLDEAAERWAKAFGVGPFFLFDAITLDNLQYRGAPAKMDFTAALAQAGDLQIELIRQGCDRPSAYRDLYAPGEQGFHHLGLFADNYDAEIAAYSKQGFAAAAEGSVGPMRFTYFDTSPMTGFMIEVMEANEAFQHAFAEITRSSQGWDGSRPVRSQADLGF